MPTPITNDIIKEVFHEVMHGTKYMALATHGSKGTWVNPVFYAFDEQSNLYFISKPATLHMQNIEEDPRVSVAIYHTMPREAGGVAGIQLSGVASSPANIEESADFHDIYFARPGAVNAVGGRPPVRAHMGEKPEWQVMKIKPTEVFLFVSKHGADRHLVDPVVWSNLAA